MSGTDVGSGLLKREFEREVDRDVEGVDEPMSEEVSESEVASDDSMDWQPALHRLGGDFSGNSSAARSPIR